MYMRGEPRRIAGLLLHDQMRYLLFLRVFACYRRSSFV